jgi:epoxide hydrolase-like predicted phosphatase
MTEIKAVISDLGRVLVDFDNWIFLRKMETYSPFSAEQMMELVRADRSILRDFDRGNITPNQFYERALKLFEAAVDKGVFFRIYNDIFSLNPEMVSTLKSLRGTCRLVLLSNTDIMRYQFVTAAFPEILFFDAYVLSYQVGVIKPEPEIYKIALGAAGVPAEVCVFIDDLEINCEAAEKLGIRSLQLKPGTDIAAALQGIGIHL